MRPWSNTPSKTGRPACLLAALSLLLAACAPVADDGISIGLASAPVTLDPRFATDATSSRINRLLYARLVEFDERQLPIPGLADWELLSPTHYRFHLRNGEVEERQFHDGERLTAQDVKATYDSVLDPATASPHRATLSIIDDIKLIDTETLDFHLSKPDILFPAYLVIGILPKKLLDSGHAFNLQPLGSGAFSFVDWPEDGRLNLRRRDGQDVSFVRVADATVRVLKLLRGEIDMLQNDLPPELVRFLEKRKDIQVTRARGSNFTYLGFNMHDPVAGNDLIRRAIAHAIDREAVIHYVMGESARLASALLPPGHWAGHPGLEKLAYDPGKARALLAEAGYSPEHPLQLVYKTSTNAYRVRLATVLQSQLADVGIDIDLRSYDWGTFYGDIKAGNFQVFSLSWVGIKSPDIFRYVFHSQAMPPNGANRGRFSDPQVDRLIGAAESSSELDVQADYYRQLQARLLETLPYVPLWYEDHVFATRQGVSGYRVGLDGNYDGLLQVKKIKDKR